MSLPIPSAPQPAAVFTGGLLDQDFAKTCHGLLRGSARFRPVVVIDPRFSGRDAGEVMDRRPRGVPVAETLDAWVEEGGTRPEFFVVGVAFSGGRLPASCRQEILAALGSGMTVVCGLHQLLGDDLEFAEAARQGGGRLVDIRRPRPTGDLRFWTGAVRDIRAKVVGVLGTDCAVGKRTTARFLWEATRAHGMRAEMIYTGQTGWMQGYPHGFILDATLNDFVSGELERVILECAADTDPDLIIVEGQGALRNPSGPCGSEIILSGNARGIVLQHAPGRTHFVDQTGPASRLPSVAREVALIRDYGADVLAVTLSEEGIGRADLDACQERLRRELGIPVIQPLRDGVGEMLPLIREYAAG